MPAREDHMVEVITRDDLRAEIDKGSVVVVDALPAAPFASRHLPAAVNVTKEDSDDRVAEVLPDRAASIVVYSTDANCDRGPGLAARLDAGGYTDVRLYRDGIQDWADAGYPLDRS
jgi:rhodanese-related sulfurtransferase